MIVIKMIMLGGQPHAARAEYKQREYINLPIPFRGRMENSFAGKKN